VEADGVRTEPMSAFIERSWWILSEYDILADGLRAAASLQVKTAEEGKKALERRFGKGMLRR